MPPELTGEDGHLVDLVDSVLVDPNLHTDQRMRLQAELRTVLRRTHADLYGPARGDEVHRDAIDAHGDHLPSVLGAVLVDPHLHTDLRMRLQHEITQVLRTAHPGDAA